MVHTLHMSKPDVIRVESATEWTAPKTLHMSKPNVTCVQIAGMDCAYFTLSKANVTRVESCGMDCFGTYFTHVQT